MVLISEKAGCVFVALWQEEGGAVPFFCGPCPPTASLWTALFLLETKKMHIVGEAIATSDSCAVRLSVEEGALQWVWNPYPLSLELSGC